MKELRIKIKIIDDTPYSKHHPSNQEISRILYGMAYQFGEKKNLVEGDGAALTGIDKEIVGEWLICNHNTMDGGLQLSSVELNQQRHTATN